MRVKIFADGLSKWYFEWLNRYRCLGKDYEIYLETIEVMINICFIRLLMCRLVTLVSV
ncbi:hypothetical protein [Acaryochloris marina]|uniref:Uncharacterized protein n=1 Tax=Acaryochloris marina (strain MBIC 11017) TaxID=329726 RepID=A8ZP87_ACAM1|nr:hypothetical protein [Acaryochloris marina]ABW32823.1 hypothetical protein AM1_E0053 [Acaryochloris marina MBIC11017]